MLATLRLASLLRLADGALGVALGIARLALAALRAATSATTAARGGLLLKSCLCKKTF